MCKHDYYYAKYRILIVFFTELFFSVYTLILKLIQHIYNNNGALNIKMKYEYIYFPKSFTHQTMHVRFTVIFDSSATICIYSVKVLFLNLLFLFKTKQNNISNRD